MAYSLGLRAYGSMAKHDQLTIFKSNYSRWFAARQGAAREKINFIRSIGKLFSNGADIIYIALTADIGAGGRNRPTE